MIYVSWIHTYLDGGCGGSANPIPRAHTKRRVSWVEVCLCQERVETLLGLEELFVFEHEHLAYGGYISGALEWLSCRFGSRSRRGTARLFSHAGPPLLFSLPPFHRNTTWYSYHWARFCCKCPVNTLFEAVVESRSERV